MKNKDSRLIFETYNSVLLEMRLAQAMQAVRGAAAQGGGHVAEVLNDLDPRRTNDMQKPLTNAEFKQLVGTLKEIPQAESTPELQAALNGIEFSGDEGDSYPTGGSEFDKNGDDEDKEFDGDGSTTSAPRRQSQIAGALAKEMAHMNSLREKAYGGGKLRVFREHEMREKITHWSDVLQSNLTVFGFRMNPREGEEGNRDGTTSLVYYGKHEDEKNPGPAMAKATVSVNIECNILVYYDIIIDNVRVTTISELPGRLNSVAQEYAGIFNRLEDVVDVKGGAFDGSSAEEIGRKTSAAVNIVKTINSASN